MLKVAILDDYQNVAQEFVDLKKLSGKYDIKVFSDPFENEDDAIEKLKDFEALLLMRERTKITSKLINNLKKLKFIATSGMRNKAINIDVAKKRKILVTGTEINVNPTCELTWALILGLARNIKPEIDNMFQGYWQTTIGIELRGKILGLIGLGRVGSQVAKIAKAFGMQVMAWSENLNLDKCKELDVLPCNKEDLIQNADFISIHLSLNKETTKFLNMDHFTMMKNDAVLINTSRGQIINQSDLENALKKKIIGGAALDVTDPEPLPATSELLKMQNVFISPHLGSATKKTRLAMASLAIKNLIELNAGRKPPNMVNE